jgi:hypothetical protein
MNWPQDKAGAGREMRQDSRVTAANSWKLAKACLLWFCLLGWLSTCRVQPAAAQDKRDLKAQVAPCSQAHVDDPVSVEDASQEPASQPEAKAAEKPDEKVDDKDEKRKHKGSIVVAPLPIVSPAIGAGIIPVFGYIFPFEEKNKISPPSAIGVAGLFTDNGTQVLAWAPICSSRRTATSSSRSTSTVISTMTCTASDSTTGIRD